MNQLLNLTVYWVSVLGSLLVVVANVWTPSPRPLPLPPSLTQTSIVHFTHFYILLGFVCFCSRFLLQDVLRALWCSTSSMWRKSVECVIFAPMCCIRALENSRLAITVLTAPTLLSTDYVIDHCGCENWLRNLTLWLLSKLLCHLENCSYMNMLLLETCEKFQPFLWLHFCFMWY